MTGHLITAPLHEETRRIVTKESRHATWTAHREGETDPFRWGYGISEQEAIFDLIQTERR